MSSTTSPKALQHQHDMHHHRSPSTSTSSGSHPSRPSTPPGGATHHNPWAHSVVCCDMDHGCSSLSASATAIQTPVSPGSMMMETYCCLNGDCDQGLDCPNPGCGEAGKCCKPDTCAKECTKTCEPMVTETCTDSCHDVVCPAEPCADACADPNCHSVPTLPATECCDDPACPPPTFEWCGQECTFEEYLQCCHDAACFMDQQPHHSFTTVSPDDPLRMLAAGAANVAAGVGPGGAVPTPVTTPQTFDLSSVLTTANTSAVSSPYTQVTPAASHLCHWQNCHRPFDSMQSLLAHLASDHLGAAQNGTSVEMTDATPPLAHNLGMALNGLSFNTDMSDASAAASHAALAALSPTTHAPHASQGGAQGDLLSCLWDDCFPTAGVIDQNTAPATTATTQQNLGDALQLSHAQLHASQSQTAHVHAHAHPHAVDGATLSPQAMIRHLLEEHLGMPGLPWSQGQGQQGLTLSSLPINLQSSSASGAHRHEQMQARAHPYAKILPPHTCTPAHIHTHGHAHLHGHDHSHLHNHAPHLHGHAHAHHLHAGHHHHSVKLPPTPSPTPTASTDSTGQSAASNNGPTQAQHICKWPGCTHTEAFASAGDLMEHLSEMHVGRGKDKYRCMWGGAEGCAGHSGEGRLFGSRQKVLRHLQSHTGHRPFVCQVCSQSFSEAAPLAAHMRRHADEKPFKCEYPGCGKRFAISSSLTIHMRTHNGEKPFVCPYCSKGFVEASNLTKHIRTHTGERPFACTHPGCGKRFTRPDQLKRHMGVHEGRKEKERAERASRERAERERADKAEAVNLVVA